MLIIRPTLSLAKRIKVKLGHSDVISTTRLGDWYASDLVLDRKQFILAVSSESRLAVVVPAAPYSSFPTRLPLAIAPMLRAIGVSPDRIAFEMEEMRDILLAKTANRSIVGTMNDYGKHLQYMAQIGRLNLSDPLSMSLWISQTPSLVMDAVFPKEAALKAFDQDPKKAPAQNPFLYLVK